LESSPREAGPGSLPCGASRLPRGRTPSRFPGVWVLRRLAGCRARRGPVALRAIPITDAFVERTRDIWEREADPSAVVAAIGALPRFRDANRARLQEHLVEVGALAVGAPLSNDAITRRAIDAAAEAGAGPAASALGPWIQRWRGELG